MGEVSWASSVSNASVITVSMGWRAPKPGVVSWKTTWMDVVMRRVAGL
jgi:hypothetical protein